jgi:hypothetical protein
MDIQKFLETLVELKFILIDNNLTQVLLDFFLLTHFLFFNYINLNEIAKSALRHLLVTYLLTYRCYCSSCDF